MVLSEFFVWLCSENIIVVSVCSCLFPIRSLTLFPLAIGWKRQVQLRVPSVTWTGRRFQYLKKAVSLRFISGEGGWRALLGQLQVAYVVDLASIFLLVSHIKSSGG